jgi:hypothetical protein
LGHQRWTCLSPSIHPTQVDNGNEGYDSSTAHEPSAGKSLFRTPIAWMTSATVAYQPERDYNRSRTNSFLQISFRSVRDF